MAGLTRTQKAKVEYPCNGCTDQIRAGALYIRLAFPPWTPEDDEGAKVGHWNTLRFHDIRCAANWEYGLQP